MKNLAQSINQFKLLQNIFSHICFEKGKICFCFRYICNSVSFFSLKLKVYHTRSSQTVPHSSTILARQCLTSVIRRERVYSLWYGRRRLSLRKKYTQWENKVMYLSPFHGQLNCICHFVPDLVFQNSNRFDN